jgi:hypothetical protein
MTSTTGPLTRGEVTTDDHWWPLVTTWWPSVSVTTEWPLAAANHDESSGRGLPMTVNVFPSPTFWCCHWDRKLTRNVINLQTCASASNFAQTHQLAVRCSLMFVHANEECAYQLLSQEPSHTNGHDLQLPKTKKLRQRQIRQNMTSFYWRCPSRQKDSSTYHIQSH